MKKLQQNILALVLVVFVSTAAMAQFPDDPDEDDDIIPAPINGWVYVAMAAGAGYAFARFQKLDKATTK